jgi:hypothetical protein
MHKEYKIDTIEDMAAIPEEALSRFLEELPDMLAMLRSFAALKAAMPEGVIELRSEPITWIDDGERNRSVCVRIEEEKEQTQ